MKTLNSIATVASVFRVTIGTVLNVNRLLVSFFKFGVSCQPLHVSLFCNEIKNNFFAKKWNSIEDLPKKENELHFVVHCSHLLVFVTPISTYHKSIVIITKRFCTHGIYCTCD